MEAAGAEGRGGAIETGPVEVRGAGRGSGGAAAGLRGADGWAAGPSPPAAAGSGGRGGSGVMMLTGGIEAAEGKSCPGDSGLATSGGEDGRGAAPRSGAVSDTAGLCSPDGQVAAWRATRRSKVRSRKFVLI